MKFFRDVSVLPLVGHDGFPVEPAGLGSAANGRLAEPVRRAIARTRNWLLGSQEPEGHWVAELEGDTILESETVLLLAFLGRENSDLARRCAERLIETQLPEGGWAMYPGGGVEISGSVKAYFALKLTGHEPGREYMQRARRAILAHGGADAVNSFTRFYLAILGQIPYEQCPEVPPEAVLVPKWFPLNLYGVSAWSRTIIVPLSIVSAMRPVRRVDPRLGIRELFLKSPEDWPPLRGPGLPGGTGLLSWDRFFRGVDRALKWCRRRGLLVLRRRALKAAEEWMLERFQHSDGLGAIFPPIVWSAFALESLGYDDESPEVAYCRHQLEDLVVEGRAGGSVKIQPCKSPVWDTAITLRALLAGGTRPDNPAILRAVKWLLDKQIMRRGDWSETVDAESGGWCFEHHNDFYPDTDDTAMVLMALAEQLVDDPRPSDGLPPELSLVTGEPVDRPEEIPCQVDLTERSAAAIGRGMAWMLAMQNDDGGWGAFDRNNNRQFLCHVPFADHNAMIDPSTPDLTGRVLECLGQLGGRVGDPAVDRAVDYLRRTQEPDGSWFGRWGVNYVYGTWQALTGLIRAGVPADDPAVAAGANWLLAFQQPCGGWGESPDSYDDPALRGQGPTTASQTAWALLGLLAAGLDDHPAVARGVQFLVESQQPDGTWDEPEFTGTGFPRVFYLRYHYYPIYFPLMALSRWAVTASASLAEAAPSAIPVEEEEAPKNRRLAVATM
ncbi:MAG: prenyltransferase/squalene oxidase repeat-containing protein [Planctomycetota bacterium]